MENQPKQTGNTNFDAVGAAIIGSADSISAATAAAQSAEAIGALSGAAPVAEQPAPAVQDPNAVPGMLDTGANTAPAIYSDPSADLGQLGSSTLASKPIHSQPTMVPGVIGKAPPQL